MLIISLPHFSSKRPMQSQPMKKKKESEPRPSSGSHSRDHHDIPTSLKLGNGFHGLSPQRAGLLLVDQEGPACVHRRSQCGQAGSLENLQQDLQQHLSTSISSFSN